MLFCVLIFAAFLKFYSIDYTINFLFLSLIITIACQLGDIFFSFLKRKAKIKDSGNFLPGHGGFLDRIDGILFGIPIGFISLLILV